MRERECQSIYQWWHCPGLKNKFIKGIHGIWKILLLWKYEQQCIPQCSLGIQQELYYAQENLDIVGN